MNAMTISWRGFGMVAVFGACLAAASVSAAEPPGEVELKPVAATASSFLQPWKGYTFGPENLIDGRADTAWQPNAKDTLGVGQWVRIDLGGEFEIRRIRLENGFQRRDSLGDLWCFNLRVKHLLVAFDDGQYVRMFSPGPDAQVLDAAMENFELKDERTNRPARTRYLLILVEMSTEPQKWKDVALSDVHVFGHAAPPLPPPAASGTVVCGTAAFTPIRDAVIRACGKGAKARAGLGCHDLVSMMVLCKSWIVDDADNDDDPGPPDMTDTQVPAIDRAAFDAGRVQLALEVFMNLEVKLTLAKTAEGWQVAGLDCTEPDEDHADRRVRCQATEAFFDSSNPQRDRDPCRRPGGRPLSGATPGAPP